MDLLFAAPKKPVNANVTVSPNVIKAAGDSARKAVQTAQRVEVALQDIAEQLNTASSDLRKNAPVLANAAAGIAQDPRVVNAVAPVVGGANAAMLQNMPRSVIAGGMRNAINEAASRMNDLAKAAVGGAKAVKEGLKEVQRGANYVAANADKLPLRELNDAVNRNANNALVGGANGFNSLVGGNVLPNVQLRANYGASHTRAIKEAAREVAREASRKADRKADRKAGRKSRKNGRKNVTRKN
jgi:hypothetical protein